MKYEIDFIGINEDSKDASAVCFRFYSEENQRYIVGVYDGGFKAHGEALVKLLNKYYFQDDPEPSIDFVICSHSDDDHASGLTEIFDNFSVNHLIMNRPWEYADELHEYISDGRKTVNSLKQELKEKYSSIAALEEKAVEQGTTIHAGFQGVTIFDALTILSPSKEMFLDLIIESSKTPLTPVSESSSFIRKFIEAAVTMIADIWGKDSIREGESTTAENETSIVIHGNMGDNGAFLLTGDAGVRALSASSDYAENQGTDLHSVNFHQIPHHGGRHNVSPSTLNRIIGNIVEENSKSVKTAFVSIGKNSDHPKKMVVNAYIRRGVKVFEARTSPKWHHHGTPDREDYSPATSLSFSSQVESWD